VVPEHEARDAGRDRRVGGKCRAAPNREGQQDHARETEDVVLECEDDELPEYAPAWGRRRRTQGPEVIARDHSVA
jgi:hypothetical protein